MASAGSLGTDVFTFHVRMESGREHKKGTSSEYTTRCFYPLEWGYNNILVLLQEQHRPLLLVYEHNDGVLYL